MRSQSGGPLRHVARSASRLSWHAGTLRSPLSFIMCSCTPTSLSISYTIKIAQDTNLGQQTCNKRGFAKKKLQDMFCKPRNLQLVKRAEPKISRVIEARKAHLVAPRRQGPAQTTQATVAV